jgi:hypothetical protein
MRKSTVRQINSLPFWPSAGNIATIRMSFTISTWLQASVYVEKGMERGLVAAQGRQLGFAGRRLGGDLVERKIGGGVVEKVQRSSRSPRGPWRGHVRMRITSPA